MPNIAAVLKDEIARIARREIKGETEGLKKAAAQYRAQIAELKRQVASLQKDVVRLSKSGSAPTAPAAESGQESIRWSAARFKAQRERLGLSAEKCGVLFSVSGQTIYNWEGGVRPGKEHLAKLSRFRKLTMPLAHSIIDAAVSAK